ncbi:hypothetical protein LAZ67_13000378 [Cordylochernes scorpioides]|uniref:Uncharacterized protein n=1 Tax=Cordylochernes scorpioides TaxID=51811 RepID=A0ABY6L5K1_9ARAC|nr:hypothetical protein LAZ67_13000378 [Cordylochernes scorpioides]
MINITIFCLQQIEMSVESEPKKRKRGYVCPSTKATSIDRFARFQELEIYYAGLVPPYAKHCLFSEAIGLRRLFWKLAGQAPQLLARRIAEVDPYLIRSYDSGNSTLRHLELFREFLLRLGTVLIQQSLQFSVLELLGRFSTWFIIKFKIATLEFFKPPETLRFAQSVVAVNFLEHSVGFSGTFLPVEGEQQNFPQMGTWIGNRHFPRAPEIFHDLNFSKTPHMLMPRESKNKMPSTAPPSAQIELHSTLWQPFSRFILIDLNASAFVIKTGSTTQWQADLAPEEIAASDMRNRRQCAAAPNMEYRLILYPWIRSPYRVLSTRPAEPRFLLLTLDSVVQTVPLRPKVWSQRLPEISRNGYLRPSLDLHFRLLGIINQLKLPFSHQILWCNSEDVANAIKQISIIKRLNCSSRSEANACVIPAVADGIRAHRIPSHFTIAHSMGIRQFHHFLELKLAILSLETFDDATIQWLQTSSHIWWKEVYLYVAETIIRDAVRRSVI